MSSRIMRTITPNARLWVWKNDGWIKLTLRPGQALSHDKSERTDEGHSFDCDRWRHMGEGVLHEWQNGGRDCDGPICTTGARSCPLGGLQIVPMAHPDAGDHFGGRLILRPEWNDVGRVEVCDVYAQAAGY